MNEAQKLGSQTAKGGFRNEDDVVENSIIGKQRKMLSNGLEPWGMIC